MAVAFVKNHPVVFNKTAGGTTIAVTLDSIVPAGNLIVARMVYDNAATASKPLVSSIARAAGETNTWATAVGVNSTSTTLGSFASGAMTYIRTTVAWPVGTYTVTLDTATTMKAGGFQEFSGALGTARGTAATNYSTTTTAASAATTGTAPVSGDLAIGFIFGSNVAAAQAGDNDTTGGSWSAVAGVGSTGSTAATNNFGVAQYKIVTSTSQQTLNNQAAMTAGNGAIVVVLQQIIDPAITQASYRLYADGTETGSTALANQDTSYALDADSGDGNLGLRVRLQSTTTAAIPTDSWRLQWERNASGTWSSVVASGTTVVDRYDVSNANGSYSLTSTNTAIGQAIRGDGRPLAALDFYMSRANSPTGTLSAVVYAHSGTFGSGVPTGAALATSTTTVTSSTVPTTSTVQTFNFDGSFTLVDGVPYFVAVVATGIGAIPNVINVTYDSSPAHLGNAAALGGSWVTQAFDLIFEARASNPPSATTVVPYDSANLTDAAATTNRLGAGTGSFVAGKVSEDGLVEDFGWTASNYTELLYSVTVKAADVANADTLRFRILRNGATTGFTYTATPTVTITKTPPVGGADVARQFSKAGATKVVLAPGAFAGAPFDYGTFAAVFTFTANGDWQDVINLRSSFASGESGILEVDTGNSLWWSVENGPGVYGPSLPGNDSYCVVVTKASGSANPRFHFYAYGGAPPTWFHQDGVSGGPLPNGSSNITSIAIGEYPGGGDYWDGRISAVGIFRHWVPNDAAVEAADLEVSLQKWVDAKVNGDRVGIWSLNQAATSTAVVDLSGGGATETALTGTSVTTGPAAFNNSLGGGPAPTVPASVRRPIVHRGAFIDSHFY